MSLFGDTFRPHYMLAQSEFSDGVSHVDSLARTPMYRYVCAFLRQLGTDGYRVRVFYLGSLGYVLMFT